MLHRTLFVCNTKNISVICKNRTECLNKITLRGKNRSYLMLMQLVRILTTAFEKLNFSFL